MRKTCQVEIKRLFILYNRCVGLKQSFPLFVSCILFQPESFPTAFSLIVFFLPYPSFCAYTASVSLHYLALSSSISAVFCTFFFLNKGLPWVNSVQNTPSLHSTTYTILYEQNIWRKCFGLTFPCLLIHCCSALCIRVN